VSEGVFVLRLNKREMLDLKKADCGLVVFMDEVVGGISMFPEKARLKIEGKADEDIWEEYENRLSEEMIAALEEEKCIT